MAAAERVKKSIYLDADLVEPLRSSAKAESRSETAQINHILRERLAKPRFTLTSDWGAAAKPDPKPGGIRPKKRK
jgi:hypothetical protein